MKMTDKIRKEWEDKGYYVLNLISTNKNGIPDYIALKDGENPIFIESKEEWDKLSPLQEYRIKELKKHKFKVFVNDAIQ